MMEKELSFRLRGRFFWCGRSGAALALVMTAAQPAMVQVREYQGSTTADVVAWNPDSPDWGLRTAVRRDGSLQRDHVVYVNTFFLGLTSSPRFVKMLEPRVRNLESSIVSDVHNCYRIDRCSPRSYLAARVPDRLLQDRPDSIVLVVPSTRDASGQVTISIPADVIAPYVATVDSVVDARRKK
jgi:hypothetical protein